MLVHESVSSWIQPFRCRPLISPSRRGLNSWRDDCQEHWGYDAILGNQVHVTSGQKPDSQLALYPNRKWDGTISSSIPPRVNYTFYSFITTTLVERVATRAVGRAVRQMCSRYLMELPVAVIQVAAIINIRQARTECLDVRILAGNLLA